MAFAQPFQSPPTPHLSTKPDWIETVLTRIGSGDTLTQCAADLGLSFATVAAALYRHVPLDVYTHTRELQGTAWLDRALAVAETATERDYNSKRLYVDTLKWAAAKVAPRLYGDRMHVQQSGDITIRVVDDDAKPAYAETLGTAAPLPALTDGSDEPTDAISPTLDESSET